MQHKGDTLNEISELVDRLAGKLAERERLLEESLPPQLRKVRALATGPCEGSRSYGYDPTGENAVDCGADGVERPSIGGLIFCDHCFRGLC